MYFANYTHMHINPTEYLRTNKGFTLIELLIVVAIIGVLAAIAIPEFYAYRTRTFDATAKSDLKIIKTYLEAFYVDNFYYP